MKCEFEDKNYGIGLKKKNTQWTMKMSVQTTDCIKKMNGAASFKKKANPKVTKKKEHLHLFVWPGGAVQNGGKTTEND